MAQHHFLCSELDIFKNEGYDMSILSTQNCDVYPTSPLSEASVPLTFIVNSTDAHYIDLSKTRLYIRAKIVKSNGDALEAANIAAPVNNVLHSLFSQCSVLLNETLITPSNMYYAHRSMIERMLLFSKEYNETQSECSGYYKDEDPASADGVKSSSYKTRSAMCAESKVIKLIGRPHVNRFAQPDFLPPGVDMKVVFQRSTDEFATFVPPGVSSGVPLACKISILEAKLQIVRHKVLPAAAINHIRQWENNDLANIYLTRVDVKSFALLTGTLTRVEEGVFKGGQLPQRLVIAIAPSTNVNGSVITNPFVFSDFNLSHINVSVNEDTSEAFPLKVDFRLGSLRVKEALSNLFRSIGIENKDASIDYNVADFVNNKTLFVYEISPITDARTPPRFGNIKIEFRFREDTKQPLTVLCYTETQGVLNIDKNKSVFFRDYSQNHNEY